MSGPSNTRRQAGFTIVELMIATAVLSTVLVLVSVVMVNIGKLYFKGINQSRIQDNVRMVTDEVAQHLKLGDSYFHVVSGNEQAYCIGDTRYTFVLYKQIGSDASQGQSRHVLWRDANPTPSSCPAELPDLNSADPDNGNSDAHGTELIAPNSRLTDFNITSVTGTAAYNLTVGEAYGDNDLLCDTGFDGDCSPGAGQSHMNQIISGAAAPSGPVRCKGSTGDQFCATSRLTSTVTRRLPPN